MISAVVQKTSLGGQPSPRAAVGQGNQSIVDVPPGLYHARLESVCAKKIRGPKSPQCHSPTSPGASVRDMRYGNPFSISERPCQPISAMKWNSAGKSSQVWDPWDGR
jgi:hypothetical protein